MTQYSSREPFNDDPTPILHPSGRRTPTWSFYSEFEPGESGPFGRISKAAYDARPEFDRPQTNPTNRMLTWARRAQADGDLEAFCEGFLEYRNTEHPEIDHAQRVLARLANLKEKS